MDQLRTKVKAAAVANLTDARYFAALGVDYLGFALEQGAPGAVGPELVAALRDWIEGPLLVGEFGGTPVETIARLSAELDLQRVQVGPFGKTAEVAAATGRPVLQELFVGTDLSPDTLQTVVEVSANSVDTFVVNATATNYPWAELRRDETWMRWLTELCTHHRVLIDIPAPAAQVDELLAATGAYGIQLRGGEEEAAGVKSFEELDAWFDALLLEG